MDCTLQINEDRFAPTAADGTGLSPGIEVEPDDRRLSRVRGDHPGTPGRGAAIPAECGGM
jgi:hypothetical protein